MSDLLQLTLDGLLDGGAYALLALGLSLTFGCLRRLNLAYGATAMLAAYIGAWLYARYQVPVWAVALAVVAAATLIGCYVEQMCFAPASGEAGRTDGTAADPRAFGSDGREMIALASSFAIWMQLEQLAVNLLPRHLNIFPSLASEQNWFAGEIMIRPERLLLCLLAVALTLGLSVWLQRTRTGLSWRAASDHRIAAHLSGMPVPRLQTAGFAVACALSGLAAFAVLAVEGQVTPMFGMWFLLKGLVAAMLGGLGSVRGVLWGGFLLGLAESYAQSLLGAQGREFATYALLLLVLIWPRAGRRFRLAAGGIRS